MHHKATINITRVMMLFCFPIWLWQEAHCVSLLRSLIKGRLLGVPFGLKIGNIFAVFHWFATALKNWMDGNVSKIKLVKCFKCFVCEQREIWSGFGFKVLHVVWQYPKQRHRVGQYLGALLPPPWIAWLLRYSHERHLGEGGRGG